MNVSDWLLDSDPAIRWQVKRDLLRESPEVVAAERSKVATEGWGARLLALQGPTGQWGRDGIPPVDRSVGLPDPATRKLLREVLGISVEGLGSHIGVDPQTLAEWEETDPPKEDELADKYRGAVAWMWGGIGTYNPAWTSTTHTLVLLRDMGVDPANERVRRAVELVRDNAKWDDDGQDYFDGESEPCVNGKTVATGVYFGQNVDGIVERLLGEQLEDGGWNCEAVNGSVRSSFHSTIEVIEGLLEYETSGKGKHDVRGARLRAQEYLLARRLFRRRSTGETVNEEWTSFSYPTRWHYDVLRGLDYLRKAGAQADERVSDAIDLVESKRQQDGRWLLENSHQGRVHFEMDEGDGKPSKWNTLRALRVLDWFGRAAL